MKSIKPGRGPSFMSAFSSIAAIIFGIFWTSMAATMGAPGFFPLFGLVFIGLGVAQLIYHLKNATGRNRFSSFDITENNEEPDPLNRYFNKDELHGIENEQINKAEKGKFCPYCGARVKQDHLYCEQCGRSL